MADDIATLTMREWVTMRLLTAEPTSSVDLRRWWDGSRYRGKVHDVLYRLEERGYAAKGSADYHATGTSWYLTSRGVEVRQQVDAMLQNMSRRS